MVRKIYEYLLGIDLCSLNKLELKKDDLLLFVEWSWTGYELEDWTGTVARRLPDDKQGDFSKYIRPLPLPEDSRNDIRIDSILGRI